MSKPSRPNELAGSTYRLQWAGETETETYYLTINHVDRDGDGKLSPHELFFNTKNVIHYPWMWALARMISAVFQRGANVSFVAYELQEVFDPRGGQIVGKIKYRSLLDMIGRTIELHMKEIGYIEKAPTLIGEHPIPKPIQCNAGKVYPVKHIPGNRPTQDITAAVRAIEKSLMPDEDKDNGNDFDVRGL
jgi:ribonucleoside-diphosphate reductase alpha chain